MTGKRRSIPYPGSGNQVYIPVSVWDQTLEALRYYGKFRSEGLVYWGGIIGGQQESLVTSLLRLNHSPQGGHVRPTEQEMRHLIRTLRERDEKLIAQVHSHPGAAFHSDGDDANATSYHDGFLSLVIPKYGQGVTSLAECAIYEFRGEFEHLSNQEVSDRFCLYSQSIDLMPTPRDDNEEKPTLWNELSKRLKRIVRRKL